MVPAPHSTPELPTYTAWNHSEALNSSLGLCPPGGGHGPQGWGLKGGGAAVYGVDNVWACGVRLLRYPCQSQRDRHILFNSWLAYC